MPNDMIFRYLKEGKLMELYDEGYLDVGRLRMAVDNDWIDVETANNWYAVLMDI